MSRKMYILELSNIDTLSVRVAVNVTPASIEIVVARANTEMSSEISNFSSEIKACKITTLIAIRPPVNAVRYPSEHQSS